MHSLIYTVIPLFSYSVIPCIISPISQSKIQ